MAEPTAEELNKIRFEAAGLTPLQQEAVKAGAQLPATFYPNSSITSESLTNKGIVNVPPPPTPATADTKGGYASIDFFNNKIATDSKSTDKTDFQSFLNQFSSAFPAPTATAPEFEKTYNEQINPLQENILGKQTTLKAAQGKLAGINAELEGLKAEEAAVSPQLQQESLGRGRTEAGVAPLSSARLRDIGLRALPIQARAAAAQAEVFSAQGDVELAQGALKIASDRLKTLFDIKNTDATNQYNYWRDLRGKVFDYLTDKEKSQIAAQQREDDKKFQLEKDNINNQQALSIKFMENGQADIASKVAQLDPKSATFLKDLASLQAQYVPKVTKSQIIGSATTGYYTVDNAGNITPLKTEGGTPIGVKFTITQLNTGAAKAGLSTESFRSLNSDVQNFYIHASAKNLTDLQDAIKQVKNGDVSAENAKTEVDSLALNPPVKEYFKSLIDKNASGVAPSEGILSTIWNGIKSLVGF